MENIQEGSITFGDMESIAAKQPRFEGLYVAKLKPSEYNDVERVRRLLEVRNAECKAFRKYKYMMYAFCHKLETEGLRVNGKYAYLATMIFHFFVLHLVWYVHSEVCS